MSRDDVGMLGRRATLAVLCATAVVAAGLAPQGREKASGPAPKGEDAARPPKGSDKPREAAKDMDEAPKPRVLEVTATVGKKKFERLEPIVVRFIAKNVSRDRIQSPINDDIIIGKYSSYRVEVRDGRGELVPKTEYQQSGGLTKGDKISGFDPGAGFHDTVVANLVRDMTAGGKYTIVVKVPYYVVEVPFRGRVEYAASEPVEVHVGGGIFRVKEEEAGVFGVHGIND